MIRLTCRDPLHDGALSAQYERLFEGKHGILKDIHFSSKLQDPLQAAQPELLESGRCLGGHFCHALRHMSFAQPRFDSFVKPKQQSQNPGKKGPKTGKDLKTPKKNPTPAKKEPENPRQPPKFQLPTAELRWPPPRLA